MKWITQSVQKILGRSLLNPASWLGWAGVLIAAWLAAHLLGWRADTAIICGTVDISHGSMHWVMLRGMFYAITWFGAIIVGPILVAASLLYWGMAAALRKI
ncbi:MAG TPA: hypothetical protein VHM90_12160 [Phycisphaerae bacterium]|jgi:hypothetical protein|nr:hypothetical protein [Phycisphaerae bacterium]